VESGSFAAGKSKLPDMLDKGLGPVMDRRDNWVDGKRPDQANTHEGFANKSVYKWPGLDMQVR
jgi:hypothetical protein